MILSPGTGPWSLYNYGDILPLLEDYIMPYTEKIRDKLMQIQNKTRMVWQMPDPVSDVNVYDPRKSSKPLPYCNGIL